MLVFPNAKINLGLRVIRRRHDGFHDIESVIHPIALRDVLEILPAADLQRPDGHVRRRPGGQGGKPAGHDAREGLLDRPARLHGADEPHLVPHHRRRGVVAACQVNKNNFLIN